MCYNWCNKTCTVWAIVFVYFTLQALSCLQKKICLLSDCKVSPEVVLEKVGKKILFRVLLLSERHSRGNKEGLRSWSCVCRINHALSQLIIGNFKLSCHGNKFFLYPHRNCELKKSNVFNGNNKSPYPFKKAYSYIEGPIYRPWCGCTTKQPGAI